MKIYIVQNVARQVEGELIVVQVEKAYLERSHAERHLSSLSRQRTEILTTEAGQIQCFCVRGIYEVEVEESLVAPPREKPRLTTEQIDMLQELLKEQGKA